MPTSAVSFEQCGELKFGQVGIANLRIQSLDIDKLCAEMRDRVVRGPKLFKDAAIILDFSALTQCPPSETVDRLIDGLRLAGVLPVAIAYGTPAVEQLALQVGLPLLAKFRSSYERESPVIIETVSPIEPVQSVVEQANAPSIEQGMIHLLPLRSGQQIYANNKDLTVCAMVGAGAEAIADGSIHIYGPLRGRALAGASGNEKARIFCREFNAELVAIAGTYKVLDEVPKKLIGKAVQIWLENDQLRIEELL